MLFSVAAVTMGLFGIWLIYKSDKEIKEKRWPIRVSILGILSGLAFITGGIMFFI